MGLYLKDILIMIILSLFLQNILSCFNKKNIFSGYMFNGWGIIIYNNQNIFKGRFSNDKANGFGYYLYKNGKKIGLIISYLE